MLYLMNSYKFLLINYASIIYLYLIIKFIFSQLIYEYILMHLSG